MKLAIIVDSSCGLTKKQAEERGLYFLPLHIILNDKDYMDGIDIDAKKYNKIININTKVRTSSSSPKEIINLFDRLSKTHDQIIVYPLAKKLSSQWSNLNTFAKDYKNIKIIKSHGLSQFIVIESLMMLEMSKQGKSIEEIIKYGNKSSKHCLGLLMPATMDWLVKGGRVTGATAALANMLKIIPIIKFHKTLDKFGKGRTISKTLLKAYKTLERGLKDNEEIILLNANNPEINKIMAPLNNYVENKTIKEYAMPNVILNHTGPGAVALLIVSKESKKE